MTCHPVPAHESLDWVQGRFVTCKERRASCIGFDNQYAWKLSVLDLIRMILNHFLHKKKDVE
jgi:hypothetical protein